jgi:hypothetical protein
MMLAGGHYMPVLKLKGGEKAALRALAESMKSDVIPLLELVERQSKDSLDAHLNRAFRRLAESLRGYPRCLIDAHALHPDGETAAQEVFQRARQCGIAFTPVTGLTRTADVRLALEHGRSGLALRLVRPDFEAGRLTRDIQAFLTRWSLTAHDVDLIVDLGSVTDLVVLGAQALEAQFLTEVPDPLQWRTLTVSACAFPLNMSRVERRSHDLVERVEWLAWRDGLHAGRAGLARLPAYGDASIQHPLGVEGFDFRTMQVSAAIRYTANDSWLLIKGESTRNLRPSIQFPALATLLVQGDLRRFFRGASHCAGCRGMQAAASGERGFGSAGKWRELGTIHHVTTVVEQLAKLSSPRASTGPGC